MSGVGVLCFAASYAIAFVLEIALSGFRSSFRNGLVLFWTIAGLVAHSAYLSYQHAVLQSAIDGAESYFFVSAWGLVLLYLYLRCYHPKTPFGFVFWPIILSLIVGGVLVSRLPSPSVPAVVVTEAVSQIAPLWKRLHAGTFFFATLSVSLGFVAGVMYLTQDRRLRRKQPAPRFLKLPTLEWSLSVCRQSIGASIFLSGACIFSGLNLRAGTVGEQVRWDDPLVFGTLLLFGFLLLFSGVLWGRFFKREGRHVALLTLSAFLFLVAILVLGLLLGGTHWNRDKKTSPITGVSARFDDPTDVSAGKELPA